MNFLRNAFSLIAEKQSVANFERGLPNGFSRVSGKKIDVLGAVFRTNEARPVGVLNEIMRSDNIDTATTRANREIELLNEYRTRLIADVVTGKLDVHEEATQLPDEVADAESLEEADDLVDEAEAMEDDLEEMLEEVEA